MNKNENLTDRNFGLCLHFQHNLALFSLCNCAYVNKQRVNKCAQQNAARDCHARRDGHAMWVACNRARFPATRPCVFCELKIMKIVILIY